MSDKERYPTEWSSVPSVTEILNAFPGPALIAWYKRMAFTDLKAVSEKSLDIGKTLHELRIRIEKGEPFEILTKYPDEVQNCIQSYFQWKKERGLMKLEYSEYQMFSAKLGYKGTFDDMFSRNGDLILLEYKTSSGIFDDHLEQAVAYKKLFEKTEQRKIREVWVVRFPKTKDKEGNVAPEQRQVLDSEMDDLFQSFNHKLAILQIRKRRELEWKSKSVSTRTS